MNLLDYVSKTHVKTARFDYEGQELEFFYKDLTGTEGELVTEKLSGVMAMISKQKADANYLPSSNELKDMNLMRDFTLWLQLCNAAGENEFHDVEAMKAVIPVKILDLASKAIPKASIELAEKNSKNLSGLGGCSDSQTDKTPRSKVSLTTTATMS
jgi:hypothetical protein